ncbi:hypothetical protein MMC29_006093 [Sticta canariensis]|nr:hypothetical protein [Sticta canariensis]
MPSSPGQDGIGIYCLGGITGFVTHQNICRVVDSTPLGPVGSTACAACLTAERLPISLTPPYVVELTCTASSLGSGRQLPVDIRGLLSNVDSVELARGLRVKLFADENLVPLPALIVPRCANHSHPPYPYPLTDATGGPNATPTGSDIFPTSPIGTGSRTAGPKGPSGSGFPTASYLYSIANLSTTTVVTNSARNGYTIGSSFGVFPLPTSNASVGGTSGPSGGSNLPISYPYGSNLTGTPLTETVTRPTAPILTFSTSGTRVDPRRTGTGESTSPPPGSYGNSSSVGSSPTGGVTGTVISSKDIPNYYLPSISGGTSGASASSTVASPNSSTTTVTSTLSGSFTQTATIDPSLSLSVGTPPGLISSDITSPTGVGNSSLSGSSPPAGPSGPSIPLVPYYPYITLTPGTIASGTSPVSGTGVPNTSSTGTDGSFTTTSAGPPDVSVPPTGFVTDISSVSDPNSLPFTPTSPTLNSGSSGSGLVGVPTTNPGGNGGSSIVPTTFDTSIKSTGTTSQNIVPTEYFYHHRRPQGYGSPDSYGYDYDFDFEDDDAYE